MYRVLGAILAYATLICTFYYYYYYYYSHSHSHSHYYYYYYYYYYYLLAELSWWLYFCPGPDYQTFYFNTDVLYTYCVSKNVPSFKVSVTLRNRNNYQNFHTAKKRTKFGTKPIRHYPLHLSSVATLPWKTNQSNFLQIFSRYGKMQTNCIFIPSNFDIYPQILTF